MLYEHLSQCPTDQGFSRTVTAYGIIPMESNLAANIGKPVLLVKQRDGSGAAPWHWDLPGGAAEPGDVIADDDPSLKGSHDRSIRRTLQRELAEEVRIHSDNHIRIGDPLYETRGVERRVIEHHLFLVLSPGPPREGSEAVNIAWINPLSALGLKIAGFDPQQRFLGPTAVMMLDGFSVLSKPLYDGELTAEIKSLAPSELSSNKFSLIDKGCYFARLNSDGTVKVYRRLNPFSPSGHLVGNLEHLA